MSFKPTLVALAKDATDFPFLGFPVTEIQLVEPNSQGAGIPRVIGFDSRDKFTEGVTGSDTKVARRKLGDLEMRIDFVDADKKAEIERLILDDRTVYFCPNMGPETRWSLPLQRSLDDFTGRKTMANTRTGKAYLWDAVDRVFRVVDVDEPQFGFRGAWARYLRTQTGQDNSATKPHPDSVSSGWSTSTGLVAQTYSEDILTPVLSERQTVNGKGVYFFEVDDAIEGSITHFGAPVSVTNSVVGSVCIAWGGSITVTLENSTGVVIYDTFTGDGDGGFQLIRLGGGNSDGAAIVRIQIVFNDTGLGIKQTAMIGPTFIGSDNNAVTPGNLPKIVDWSDGVAFGSDTVAATDTADHLIPDATITFFAQWIESECSYVTIGSSATIIIRKTSSNAISVDQTGGANTDFSNIDTTFSLVDGQWFHCAVTLGPTGGLSLFVNGEPHFENGDSDWEPVFFDSPLRIGTDTQKQLDGSGISHVRCDAREWSEQEVKDHHETYFKGAGRGIVEPLFGKKLVIESVDWAPQTVSDAGAGDVHWRGTMILRELGPNDGLAGLIRQEGSP